MMAETLSGEREGLILRFTGVAAGCVCDRFAGYGGGEPN